MAFTRRHFLGATGAATAALLAGASAPVVARRFTDTSGLTDAHFIWQPTLAPSGPVVIIMTQAHNVVHVYRGGKLLGIAKTLPRPGKLNPAPDGVYELDAARASAGVLSWSGQPRFQQASAAASKRVTGMVVAPKFARLLADATSAGCMVIVTSERSAFQTVQTFAPFSIGPMSNDRLSAFAFVTGSISKSAGLLGDDHSLRPRAR